MKLFLNSFVFSFFLFSVSAVCEELSAEYKIEFGKIDIGKVYWSLSINDNNYEINLKVRDKGFLSVFYKFNGKYFAKGKIEGGEMFSSFYSQSWKTEKKRRDIKIGFKNKKVSELFVDPKEKEKIRIRVRGEKFVDPLTSFLNMLKGKKASKTIDGRRIYSMVLTNEEQKSGAYKKNILIKDYLNLWAEHNRNDLKSISFEKKEGEKEIFFPNKISIKYKKITFKLIRI